LMAPLFVGKDVPGSGDKVMGVNGPSFSDALDAIA